ncbi:MAG TPA: Flp family type IVb pilin [Candidatus Elarobacter sp.]|jgi:pilus assembly protein Flp/PilA
MIDSLNAMLRDDEGATLVEYSLVVALIAGVCIAVIGALGTSIQALFTTVGTKVQSANNGVQ